MTPATHPRTRRVEGLVPERPVLGFTLLSIGAIILAGFAIDGAERYTLLALSVVFVTAFALSREYGFAIPAGITGGLGSMVLLTSGTLDPVTLAALPFLSMAAGFGAVWLLGLAASPRAVHPWPLVPATVLGLIGAGVALRQPMTFDWIQVGVAAVLVVAGTAMVLRRDRTAR